MNDETDKNDDSSLFRQMMKDVTPLKPDNKVRRTPPPKKLRKPRIQQDETVFEGRFSEGMYEEHCPDQLYFERAGGAQKSMLKKMRTGKLPVENVLDLHGLTVHQASRELAEFLDDCQRNGYRHVMIIHGKGYRSQQKPVIKPMVNRWLKQAHEVLAFSSAQPKDGGTGAVYVLLRKT